MYFVELIKHTKGMSIELVVWALYFGLLLACLLLLYEKRVVGKLVRKLLAGEAVTPEKAMTLPELGFGKNPFIKQALRGKTALSALIFTPEEAPAVGEDLHVTPVIRGKFDVETTRFYIPEPLRHRAAVRFDGKGSHFIDFVVAALLFGVLAWLTIEYLPTVIDFVKQFFGLE